VTGDTPDPLPQDHPLRTWANQLGLLAERGYRAANRYHQSARSTPWALSMSGLGGCVRQAAFRLAGTEPSDAELSLDQDARQALHGTWVHAGLLPHYVQQLASAHFEVPLRLDVFTPDGTVTIHGSADVLTADHGGGIVDVKTVGAHQVPERIAKGASWAHRWQVRGYAAAARQQGFPVTWISWLYIDRDTGHAEAHIEPFTDQDEQSVHARIAWLVSLAAEPDETPSLRGPGLDWACDSCAWLRRCWGPDATPGDRSVIAYGDDENVTLAAKEYVRLRDQKSALEDEMEFWSAAVGRPAKGQYGDLTITYSKDGSQVDPAAAAKLLNEMGVSVPMRPVAGRRYVRRAERR